MLRPPEKLLLLQAGLLLWTVGLVSATLFMSAGYFGKVFYMTQAFWIKHLPSLKGRARCSSFFTLFWCSFGTSGSLIPKCCWSARLLGVLMESKGQERVICEKPPHCKYVGHRMRTEPFGFRSPNPLSELTQSGFTVGLSAQELRNNNGTRD